MGHLQDSFLKLCVKAVGIILITGLHCQDLSPPHQLVSFLGGTAAFRCFVSLGATEPASNITWTVNSTSLENFDLTNLAVNFISDARLGVLTFLNLSLFYNNSMVKCHVEFPSGVIDSDTSVLIIREGFPSEVRFLELSGRDGDIVSLNWTAPVPSDILNLSPVITYSVSVVNSTSSATLHSEHGITATAFAYTLPPVAICNVLLITVTPVNMVGPGDNSSIQYEPMEVPQISDVLPSLSVNGEAALLMSAPVCRAELTLVDIDTGEKIILGDTDLVIAATNIKFTTERLRENQGYNITAIAFNAAGSNISSAISGVALSQPTTGSTAGTFTTIQTNQTDTTTSHIVGQIDTTTIIIAVAVPAAVVIAAIVILLVVILLQKHKKRNKS